MIQKGKASHEKPVENSGHNATTTHQSCKKNQKRERLAAQLRENLIRRKKTGHLIEKSVVVTES